MYDAIPTFYAFKNQILTKTFKNQTWKKAKAFLEMLPPFSRDSALPRDLINRLKPKVLNFSLLSFESPFSISIFCTSNKNNVG